jgi:hypothetical protein
MPGSGKKAEKMYARIRLQYLRVKDNKWLPLGPTGDSGWLSLGAATYLRRETGRTFTLAAPPPGQNFRIRAIVAYEWRKGKAVVRQAYKSTKARKTPVTGADPVGYSAADCVVVSP